MFKIICVTNRKLCTEDFFVRMEKIASAKPDLIILREKDLDKNEYLIMAEKIAEICGKYGVPLNLHTHITDGMTVHLPLPILSNMNVIPHVPFGVSVHSAEEAQEAESLGASYITAGHVFATDCKKGLAPRGTDFLRNVCESVNIPVYAIGGINAENIAETVHAGADGACIMSGFMTCSEPQKYIEELRNAVKKL